jgi:hypothetical protein
MSTEDKIKRVIQNQFDELFVEWQVKALYNTSRFSDSLSSIVCCKDVDDENLFPLFVLEILYDSRNFKHLSFIAKFNASTNKRTRQDMATILMDYIDSKRERLLETSQTIRNVKAIRFLTEYLTSDRFPSTKDCSGYFYLYSVGKPLDDSMQRRNGWLVNSSFGVALHGCLSINVELKIFEENNLTKIPTSKRRELISISTGITVAELKEEIRRTTGTDYIHYSIGTVFTDENTSLDDDHAQVCSIIGYPDPNEPDISCLVVYGQDPLM